MNDMNAADLTYSRTDKDWRELDFSAVDFSNGQWSWSSTDDRGVAITHTDDRLHLTRYVLPDAIAHIVNTHEKFGRDDALRAVRRAIGAADA